MTDGKIPVAEIGGYSSRLGFRLNCDGSIKGAIVDVKLIYEDVEYFKKGYDAENFSGNLTFNRGDAILDFEPREIQLNSSKKHSFVPYTRNC
jgi:hypothetical protein